MVLPILSREIHNYDHQDDSCTSSKNSCITPATCSESEVHALTALQLKVKLLDLCLETGTTRPLLAR